MQRIKNSRKPQTQSEATDQVKSAGDCVILLLCHCGGEWMPHPARKLLGSECGYMNGWAMDCNL